MIQPKYYCEAYENRNYSQLYPMILWILIINFNLKLKQLTEFIWNTIMTQNQHKYNTISVTNMTQT